MTRIHIRNSERVLFVGRTGSGKTVLAKHFLANQNRVLVLDPKNTFRLDGYRARRSLPLVGSEFRIIYRPRLGDDEQMADLVYSLMRLKNATIYVDELAVMAESYPATTGVLAQIAMTGRERKVTVWAACQRPRWTPRIFFTEAECVFMFNMRSGEDRAYMAQFVGPEALDPIERYEFWYNHADEETPALMRYNMEKRYIELIGQVPRDVAPGLAPGLAQNR